MNQPRQEWNEQLLSHFDWLRIVVRSRLSQPQNVDDVLQDVMADALAVNPAEIRMVKPWLYRLAIRKVYLSRRSAGRKRRAYNRLETEDSKTSDSPLDLVLGKERRHLVAVAMKKLSGKDIEVLVLKYVHHWSYQTISDNLGISLSKVTHRLRLARARLRTELTKMIDAEDLP